VVIQSGPSIPNKKLRRKQDAQAQLLMQVRARDGKVSRVELAKALGVAPSTSGFYVSQLIEEGYLREMEKGVTSSGRPPTHLSLNPSGGQFVGVDFEAHQIKAIALDFSQKPIKRAEDTIQPGETLEQVLRKVLEIIRKVRAPRLVLHGIGVGVPGPVDPKYGTALYYDYIPGWRNVPVKAYLEEAFGVPVQVENNIRAMVYAELCLGGGRDLRDIVCIAVRTGIGVGLSLNGLIHHGAGNLSGEIGWWPVPGRVDIPQRTLKYPRIEFPDGMLVKEIATVDALLQRTSAAIAQGSASSLSAKVSAGKRQLDFEDIVEAVKNRDPLALKMAAETGVVLGRVAAEIALLIDPEAIYLTGPLVRLEEAILGPANDALGRLTFVPFGGGRKLEASHIGEFAGALGAASLALNAWVPQLPPAREKSMQVSQKSFPRKSASGTG
jgi:N-acetylglucosamine repressor